MAQKRPCVLVVDDDAGIRRALTRLFERDGLDVHAVRNGAEALAAFAARAPDLAANLPARSSFWIKSTRLSDWRPV